MDLPEKVYTATDISRARRNGKLVGWFQGAAVVVVGGMVLSLLGWVPTVIVVGGLGYVGYRLLRPQRPPEDT